MDDVVARFQEIERRGLLNQVNPEKQALWAEYKRRHPELTSSENVEETINLQPMTDEQKAQAQADAEKMRARLNYQSVPMGAVTGTLEGLNYGLGRLASGLTLGLSDKLVPQEKPDFSEAQTAGDVISGGLELIGSLPTSAGIYKGVKAIPYISKATLPVAGAIEGGATRGISTGDIEEAGKGAIEGGLTGTALKGIQKASGVLPEFLGLTTGSGSSSIKQAIDAGKRGSKPFLESMRKGSEATSDIINLAENDFKQLGRQNYEAYKNKMSKIGGVENIDFKPIKDTYNKILQEEAGGKPYLMEENTKKVLTKVGDMLDSFSKDNKKTLKDYDDLKQAIGKINPPMEAGNAKRVQGELYNAVKGEIGKQAPVYSDIMKESAEGIEKLSELKKTFSLGKKSAGDTVLRKLQSANRNNVLTNYGRREELLRQLPHGEELADRIAGQTLNSLTPRGLEARAAGLFGSGASFAGMFNPAYLVSASPRVVGETAYKAGQLSRILKPEIALSGIYAEENK
jgi:hypothetical protein